VAEGELVAIVGANGAGKSSLIRTIAGIERPRAGRIRFRGADIAGQPSHRVCNLGIGRVAEGRQIFPSLTVEENLEVGALLQRARSRMKETTGSAFSSWQSRRPSMPARSPTDIAASNGGPRDPT
jgi:branched-chain amino acid transport system ATP-binding protein